MLTYPLDPAARIPLYEQLYRAIRQDLISGALQGGEKLPSKRQLAAHLRVSQVTVEAAYSQLLAEGYLRSEPRRGYFAIALPQRPAPVTIPSAAPAVARPTVTPCRYDFRTNIVDPSCFPFSTWARLSRRVLSEYSERLLLAAAPQGASELREQISLYLRSFRGISAAPECILIGAGSEYLTHLLLRLLPESSVLALENPGYRKLYQIVSANGVTVRPLPLDAGGLRADALRASDANAAYVTPSHEFPLGLVMPAARRSELLAWAEEQPDRYLIEDDYDSEFRYSSRPMPTLKELDRSDRVIYVNTFAKSLAPSLRIGYLVLPAPLMRRYHSLFSLYSSTVPSFDQHTLAAFLASGGFERHISRSRKIYQARRDTLLRAIRAQFPAGCYQVSGAEGGLHLLLQVKNGMREKALLQAAAAQDVRVYGLSAYYTPPEKPPASTVVLGYAGMSDDAIAQAVKRLADAWFSLKKD